MSDSNPRHAAIGASTTQGVDADDFARALLAGLNAGRKQIPCKYFYDAEGSALFEKICALPEYYLARTELALLARHADEFAALVGADAELVEFGAGSGRKVQLLLDAVVRPRAYLPIDISIDCLLASAARIDADYPDLIVKPVIADFSRPLALPPVTRGARRRIGFFPGSTIGNFTPEATLRFLRNAARLLRGGGLLVGVDLVKDPAVLHAAYNDAVGLTAAFNKNLMARANRELGAGFDLTRFHHHACYNPSLSAHRNVFGQRRASASEDRRARRFLRRGRGGAHREFPQDDHRGLSLSRRESRFRAPRDVVRRPAAV